jgi:hypothetical protein
MPTDRPSPKDLWTAQPSEGFSMPLEDIHAQAEKLARRVRNRNLKEYLAAAMVIGAFGWYAYALPGLLVKLGSLLTLAGTLIVVWQLHRRTAPLAVSEVDCLTHLRAELIRQRDALRSIALWYLGPLVPGMAVFLAGIYLQAPQARRHVLFTAALSITVFAGVWALNRWGARRLQKRIDAL